MDKLRGVGVCCVVVALVAVLFVAGVFLSGVVEVSHRGFEFGVNVFASVKFERGGKVVYYFSGLDPLTNLGLNLTFAKLTGNFTSGHNSTTYILNATGITLGYCTSGPNASSTILDTEFARNGSAYLHDKVYNGYNLTSVFTGFTGTNSSNCMGVNYGGSGKQNDLFGYSTFSTVSGIDSSFTITCEIQVQGTTG
jgi:hypothetical protein